MQINVVAKECVRFEMNLRLVMQRFVRLRDIHVVTRFGSHIALAYGLCADCKSRIHSSMVFDIVPRLPRLPIFEGKFIKPFNSLFRSPFRPDRVNASKVSASVHSRSTDSCRLDLDAAASTAGPMDSVLTVWSVYAWLRNASAYLVSHFNFLCLIDLYSFNLNPATSTPWSIDPIAMFRWEFGWLRGLGTSAVSRFTLLHWFLIDMLDLDLYRFDLHATASASPSNKSNDSIGPF